MKKILIIFLVALSCSSPPVQQPLENSVVYEMNVRQYTPEGTLAAAVKQLPRSYTTFGIRWLNRRYFLMSWRVPKSIIHDYINFEYLYYNCLEFHNLLLQTKLLLEHHFYKQV